MTTLDTPQLNELNMQNEKHKNEQIMKENQSRKKEVDTVLQNYRRILQERKRIQNPANLSYEETSLQIQLQEKLKKLQSFNKKLKNFSDDFKGITIQTQQISKAIKKIRQLKLQTKRDSQEKQRVVQDNGGFWSKVKSFFLDIVAMVKNIISCVTKWIWGDKLAQNEQQINRVYSDLRIKNDCLNSTLKMRQKMINQIKQFQENEFPQLKEFIKRLQTPQ